MTIDLTGIIVSFEGGVFSVVLLVVGAWINARLKDKQAAATLDAAIGNALGKMQQAAEAATRGARPSVTVPIPGVPQDLTIGVQYVLDHAGDEAARFGVSPAAIADKVSARIGLANIATNLATASSPDPAPPPLAPVVAPSPTVKGS